ncbi:hypothetical protein EJB05_34235, partial [Eragrostis curvula]
MATSEMVGNGLPAVSGGGGGWLWGILLGLDSSGIGGRRWFGSGNAGRNNHKTHIIPCHILLAIRMAGVTIPHAGVWFREGRERDNNKTHIIPCHILLAIRNDKKLRSLLAGVTIPHAGVLPNIHLELLPKKAVEKTYNSTSKKVNAHSWKSTLRKY